MHLTAANGSRPGCKLMHVISTGTRVTINALSTRTAAVPPIRYISVQAIWCQHSVCRRRTDLGIRQLTVPTSTNLRDNRQSVEMLDAINSSSCQGGEMGRNCELGWARARTTGPEEEPCRNRIVGGHVARVCGYQGSTEATSQQRLTPLPAQSLHSAPPHVPIGVRPVDGAAGETACVQRWSSRLRRRSSLLIPVSDDAARSVEAPGWATRCSGLGGPCCGQFHAPPSNCGSKRSSSSDSSNSYAPIAAGCVPFVFSPLFASAAIGPATTSTTSLFPTWMMMLRACERPVADDRELVLSYRRRGQTEI
jgi:hypothetical protein